MNIQLNPDDKIGYTLMTADWDQINTGGAGTLNFDVSGAASSFTPSTSNPVHVYMLFSNDYTNSRFG